MPTRDTAPPAAVFGPTLAAQSDAVEIVAPNILSLAHWARLRDGELYAAQPRVDWASLLRRTFEFDVKTCPLCAGRLQVRAVVTAPGSTANAVPVCPLCARPTNNSRDAGELGLPSKLPTQRPSGLGSPMPLRMPIPHSRGGRIEELRGRFG